MNFVLQLVATLPIIAAFLLLRWGNLPRVSRYRQYPMPVFAALYVIGAAIVLYLLNDVIDQMLNGLFSLVPVIESWYDTTWQLVIENTVAITVFWVLKIIVVRLCDRAFRGRNFFGSSMVESFYEFDTTTSMWFVRQHNAMLRTFFSVFLWVSIGLTVVLLALARTYPEWPGFSALVFPALAAIVIGECSFVLNGLTRHEFEHDIRGVDDQAQRIANYSGLRDVFKQVFPGRVIDDGITFSSSDASRTHDRLARFADSTDEVDQLAALYFERIKHSGTILDTNLVGASTDVMRGRSVLISNPFYRDLTPYLVFPAYYHLLQYRKCLIVCGRDSIAEDLVEWMAGGLESITGVAELFKVGVLSHDSPSDLDVGVLRFADIHNLDLIQQHGEFLSDVHFVVLAEPSRMLATGQLGLSFLINRCSRNSTPVFAAFDRNHDGLVDSLSHVLKVELTDVVASALARGVSNEVIWKADGPAMHARVLPTVTRYLGMGTEIAAVGLKYQVAHVDWVGSDTFPVHDMMWIAGQYYSQITAFADLDISQHAISEAITPESNPWLLDVVDNRFLVVEDEIRNVYETVRLYATRASAQGFVNLISEDYLLRDYMIDSRQIFLADPKAIPSIVPDFARTERNLVLRLIMQLRAHGLSEAEIAHEFEVIGRQLPPVEAPVAGDRRSRGWEPPVLIALRELIATHVGVDQVPLTWTTELEGVTHTGDEVLRRIVRLESGGPLDAVTESLRPAYFFVEDEKADRDYVGSALYGLVFQLFLPGQFISHAGKYYEVQSIGTDHRRSGVVLRRAADHIHDRRVYRALKRVGLSSVRAIDSPGATFQVGTTEFARCLATIDVTSVGFLEQTARSDYSSARRVEVGGIPVRTYRSKELLRVRMPGIDSTVRHTLAVMLNEIFVTVFPHAYPYVIAVTPHDDEVLADLLPPLGVEDDQAQECIYIVEDSVMDLGLLVAVERNWDRLMEIVADYLAWQSETPPPAPDIVQSAVEFSGDTPEESAERARIIAEQDASAGQAPRPPAQPNGAVRWWRRVLAWFTSRRRRGAVSDEDLPIGDGLEDPSARAAAPPGAVDLGRAGDFDVEFVAHPEGAVMEPERGIELAGDEAREAGPEPAVEGDVAATDLRNVDSNELTSAESSEPEPVAESAGGDGGEQDSDDQK